MPDPVTTSPQSPQPAQKTPSQSLESPAPEKTLIPTSEPPQPDAPPESELDALGDAAFGSPEPKKPVEPKKAEPKPEPKKAEEPSKTEEKAKEEPKKEEPKAEEKPPELFRGAKEMRQAIKSRDERIGALQSERDKALNQVKELSAKLETGGNESVHALTEQLKAREQELAKAKQTISEYDYSRSDEFQQKYITPYTRAKERAMRDMQGLKVTVGEDQTRDATPQDLESLMGLPSVQARRVAKQAFGEDADVVIAHLNRLHEIRDESHAALESHRSTWEQKQKERQAQAARESEEIQALWKSVNEELLASNEAFTEGEDDEENALLRKGLEWIENAVQKRDTLTPKQKLEADATIRLKAASFDRILHQRDKLKAQVDSISAEKETKIKELEDRIKELEDSGPGPSRRIGDGIQKEDAVDEWTPEMAGFDK